MTKEWNSAGYPKEYLAGFEIPDEEAVARVVDALSAEEKPEVVVLDDNGTNPTVYLRRNGTLTQVNWAEPGKRPRDYEEYASTFWSFAGPNDVQFERSLLLARKLNVGLLNEDTSEIVSIPSEGIKFEGRRSFFE